MSKNINICIIWANPYNKNMGVSALAYSTLSLIKDCLDEIKLKGEITFVGSSSNMSDALLIGGKSYDFFNIYGVNYYNPKTLLRLLFHFKKLHTLKQLRFKYIFDIGEGDSFSDIYGTQRFMRLLNSKRFFNLLRKEQFLLPQTIGPFRNKKNEKLAFKTLEKFQYILGRDKQSVEYAKKHLTRINCTESIDVAFYLPYIKSSFSTNKLHIGINISGLLWNGGYTENNQFGLKANYKLLIKKIIEYFGNNDTCELHLVPHVVPDNYPVEDDYAVCEQLQNDYPNTILAPRFQNPIEAKSYISGLDFFTGARMHATIAAFSTGIPVYPMAYSRKFNGLYKDTLGYNWMGDCVNDNTEEILLGLINAFSIRETLKKEIQHINKIIINPRLIELKESIKSFLKR